MKESETQLKRRILDALSAAGYWAERAHSGGAKARGSHIQLFPPGTPDILCVAPYGWLEVKRPGEELNENQIAWHEKAKERGVRAVVVESVADALGAVRSWK